MGDVNLLAVLVAALCTFVLGGPWYAVFGRLWNREAGRQPEQRGHPAFVFGLAFLLSLIAAYLLARFLGPAPPLGRAVLTGLLVGAGWVATSFGVNYLFGGRSLQLWAIDAGYHTLQFTSFGAVLGAWP